jgi:hypothetical protein
LLGLRRERRREMHVISAPERMVFVPFAVIVTFVVHLFLQ